MCVCVWRIFFEQTGHPICEKKFRQKRTISGMSERKNVIAKIAFRAGSKEKNASEWKNRNFQKEIKMLSFIVNARLFGQTLREDKKPFRFGVHWNWFKFQWKQECLAHTNIAIYIDRLYELLYVLLSQRIGEMQPTHDVQ